MYARQCYILSERRQRPLVQPTLNVSRTLRVAIECAALNYLYQERHQAIELYVID